MKSILKETAYVALLASLLACQQMPDDTLETRSMVKLEINATTLAKSDIGDWESGEDSDITINGTETKSRSTTEAVKRMTFSLIGEDGSEVVSQQKNSDDEGYMTLSTEVPEGKYELVAFGHNGASSVSVGEGKTIAPSGKLTDSFLYYKELDLTGSSKTKDITLDRCVAKFTLKHTDKMPDGVTSVVIEVSGGGKVLDATTGLATESADLSSTIDIPSTAIGTANNTFSIYAFLTDEEDEVDVTVTAKDKDGKTLAKHEFKDVELEVNMQTIYTGSFFKRSQGFTASVNTEWKDSNEVEF